jgi:hypothetical protein
MMQDLLTNPIRFFSMTEGGLSWAANPIEKLPVSVSIVVLVLVWGAAGLLGLAAGCCNGKGSKQELWPILRSGLPPIPWWVLKTFCFMAAFPSLFLRYLNLVWAETTSMTMLMLSLMTGVLSLSVFAGHCFWTVVSQRTKRYRAVILGTMTVCICAVLSVPLLNSVEATSGMSWSAVILSLAAIVAGASVKPIEEAVMSAQQDWVEFATPRTTAQRLQALASQKLYATLGVLIYTLFMSGGLQLTAKVSGDLMFYVVVAIAAIITGGFYEFCMPHKAVAALTDPNQTSASTPRYDPSMRSRPPNWQFVGFCLANLVHGACAALGLLLFALRATQVLGLSILVIGLSHAVSCLFELPVLRFESTITKLVIPEVVWSIGALVTALRLYLYTYVTRTNGVWCLMSVEAVGGLSDALIGIAAGRLIQKHGKEAHIGLQMVMAERSLGNAIGCVVWGLAWGPLGFLNVYYSASIFTFLLGGGVLVYSLWLVCSGKGRGEDSDRSFRN